MTEQEKIKTLALRERGLGVTAIAQRLGISVNTVKSFCRRSPQSKGGGRFETTTVARDAVPSVCKHCGKPIHSIVGKRPRIFCSDVCRYAHAYKNTRRQARSAVCTHCGRAFHYPGTAARKFCSHSCYVRNRSDRRLLHDK